MVIAADADQAVPYPACNRVWLLQLGLSEGMGWMSFKIKVSAQKLVEA